MAFADYTPLGLMTFTRAREEILSLSLWSHAVTPLLMLQSSAGLICRSFDNMHPGIVQSGDELGAQWSLFSLRRSAVSVVIDELCPSLVWLFAFVDLKLSLNAQ